jgi:formylglycine-generating enzyme required for sulfatase activity
MPVKENWKRCPECEARLICKSCGNRIPPGNTGCPSCEKAAASVEHRVKTIEEPAAGIEFVLIPGGVFMMGDLFDEGVDNEKPIHEVRLDSFYLGKYPVTQEQWVRLMGENPSKFKGDRRPVEQVSIEDVGAFLRKVSAANRQQFEFRLPSEAEWEYAARSGGKEERYAGSDAAVQVAWHIDNSDGMTHPVGEKRPNGLGLFDMSGNVWEWCLDTFLEDAYQMHPAKNPICREKGADRVIRGGSWNIDAWSVRCARRFSFSSDFSGSGLGFRLVAVPR